MKNKKTKIKKNNLRQCLLNQIRNMLKIKKKNKINHLKKLIPIKTYKNLNKKK